MELDTWIECIALFTFINHLPWVFFPAPPRILSKRPRQPDQQPKQPVHRHSPHSLLRGARRRALRRPLLVGLHRLKIDPPLRRSGARWLDWQLLMLLFKGVAVYNRVMWYVCGVRDALKLLWYVVYGKLAAALWQADKEAFFLLLVQVAAAVDWVKRLGRDLVKVFWPSPRVSALDGRAEGPDEFDLM